MGFVAMLVMLAAGGTFCVCLCKTISTLLYLCCTGNHHQIHRANHKKYVDSDLKDW